MKTGEFSQTQAIILERLRQRPHSFKALCGIIYGNAMNGVASMPNSFVSDNFLQLLDANKVRPAEHDLYEAVPIAVPPTQTPTTAGTRLSWLP